MNVSISTVDNIFSIGKIPISNTIIWTVIILALTFVFFMYLAKGLEIRPNSKKQVIAEYMVSACRDFVSSTMGKKNIGFTPYFFALAAFLLVANLSSFVFLGIVRPPTADLATTLTLGIITFVLTQYYGLKTKGIKKYLKDFTEPVFFFLPINIIGEIANPVSLGFRLFGNITGGLIILSLVYSIFVGSAKVAMFVFFTSLILCLYLCFGKANKFTENKIVRIVAILLLIPSFFVAFCHGYFDWFAGILQTFIFCMLSMVFISSAMDEE